MHGSRLAILLGTGLVAAALLLPQVRLTSIGAVNGLDGDAWPALILLAPAVLAALWGERSRPVRLPGAVAVIAFGCLAFLFAALKIVDASEATQRAEGTIGTGAWAVPVAVLIVIGAGLVGLTRR